MADMQKLVDMLSELTVLEAAELVKALEEKWGVSAAAPVAAMAAAPAAAAAEEVEEKTEFDVVLKRRRSEENRNNQSYSPIDQLRFGGSKNMAETADTKVLTAVFQRSC